MKVIRLKGPPISNMVNRGVRGLKCVINRDQSFSKGHTETSRKLNAISLSKPAHFESLPTKKVELSLCPELAAS